MGAQKLQREKIQHLPPTLQVRKELDEARERIAVAASEAEVVAIVEAINAKIREVNRTVITGPPSDLYPLHLETVLARWRGELTG